MKFNYVWEAEKKLDEIDLISHPQNKKILERLQKNFQEGHSLTAVDPLTNRNRLVQIDEIEAISAMGHMSKVTLVDQSELFLTKKLKELVYLETLDLYRVNNSTILNLGCVQSFSSGEHARIEVKTLADNSYLVSRHYAKLIKERLS